MKQTASMILILLHATLAQAQQVTAVSPTPQQQASVDPYIASITPVPPVEQVPPAPPAAAAGAAPQPWEYGQSVITDIRQMNF